MTDNKASRGKLGPPVPPAARGRMAQRVLRGHRGHPAMTETTVGRECRDSPVLSEQLVLRAQQGPLVLRGQTVLQEP